MRRGICGKMTISGNAESTSYRKEKAQGGSNLTLTAISPVTPGRRKRYQTNFGALHSLTFLGRLELKSVCQHSSSTEQ